MRGQSMLYVLAAGLILATLNACVPVPLGDPEKSTIDSRLVGAWTWKEGERTNFAVFRAYDSRTYVVDIMGIEGTLEQPVPKYRGVYKAWIASVKNQPFINLQPIETLSAIPGEDKRPRQFLIARIALDGNKLAASGLDPNNKALQAACGTSSELEKFVSDNLETPGLLLPALNLERIVEGRMPLMDKLLKLYESGGR